MVGSVKDHEESLLLEESLLFEKGFVVSEEIDSHKAVLVGSKLGV